MPVTGVIDFLEENKFVAKIHMTNGNPLVREPVKFKTFLAEPTALVITGYLQASHARTV
jgi:hypothetical protein